jgi:hypothetical protein
VSTPRSTRTPASTRATRRGRSSRGDAISPTNSPTSSASAVNDTRSVERAAVLELKTTRDDDGERARDLAPAASGPDHRGLRRRLRNSTDEATRSHHRGMAPRSSRSPQRDHFLSTVGSVRDLVLHYARTSTWMFTLACGFACVSLQIPLPNDNATSRALFLLAAMSAGALLGKWIDRWTRRRTKVTRRPSSRPRGGRARGYVAAELEATRRPGSRRGGDRTQGHAAAELEAPAELVPPSTPPAITARA